MARAHPIFFSKTALLTKTNRCLQKRKTLTFALFCAVKVVLKSAVSIKKSMRNTNFCPKFYHKWPHLAYHKRWAPLGHELHVSCFLAHRNFTSVHPRSWRKLPYSAVWPPIWPLLIQSDYFIGLCPLKVKDKKVHGSLTTN